METLIVKVDSKKNVSFLRKLLRKFNFVLEIKTKASTKSNDLTDKMNVAGKLHRYADLNKIEQEGSVWQHVAKNKHGAH